MKKNDPIMQSKIKNKLLYNADCNTFFYHDKIYDKRGLPQSIHTFIGFIAHNGVDTFLCNPNASLAYYSSKVVETNLDGYMRGDKKRFIVANPTPGTDHAAEKLSAMTDRYLDLAEKGIDWLAEVTSACRKKQIFPWISIRMNDMHGWADLNHHHHNNSLLKNPKMRLSGRAFFPGKKYEPDYEKGMDYRCKEVRNYMFSMIKELIESYDFEGLELDFSRFPLILNPIADESDSNIIHEWIKSIRELTNAKSRKIGKAYPLGIRIIPQLIPMKEKGLDIKKLAKNRIIDFLCFDQFLQTSWSTPFDQLRNELGDIALYGGIEMQPSSNQVYDKQTKTLHKRQMSGSVPLLYGAAACKYALNADGIELFNFFCGDTPLKIGNYNALGNIVSKKQLYGKEKSYVINGSYFPCFIHAGSRVELFLPMISEPAPLKMKLVIQVIYEKKAGHRLIRVGINSSHPNFQSVRSDSYFYNSGNTYAHDENVLLDSDLKYLQPEHQSRLFNFNASNIREGWNSIELYYGNFENQDAQADYLKVVGVELQLIPGVG